MSPDIIKLTVLANVNVKLLSWTFIFCKVVRQQIWGKVLVLIQASSTVPVWTKQWKNFQNQSTFVEVSEKIKVV